MHICNGLVILLGIGYPLFMLHWCMLLFGYLLDFVVTGCSGFYADKNVFFIHTSFVL